MKPLSRPLAIVDHTGGVAVYVAPELADCGPEPLQLGPALAGGVVLGLDVGLDPTDTGFSFAGVTVPGGCFTRLRLPTHSSRHGSATAAS